MRRQCGFLLSRHFIMHHALQLAQYTNNAKVDKYIAPESETVEQEYTENGMNAYSKKKEKKPLDASNDDSLTADIHGGLADKYSLLLSSKLEQSFNIMASAIASRVFSASGKKNNGNIQIALKTINNVGKSDVSIHRWTWCEDEAEEKIPSNRIITDATLDSSDMKSQVEESRSSENASTEKVINDGKDISEVKVEVNDIIEDDEEYEAEGTGKELDNLLLPLGLGEKDYSYFYGNHEDWLSGTHHGDSDSESDDEGEDGEDVEGEKEKDNSYRTRTEKAKDGPFGGGKTAPFLVDYDNQLLYWMMEGVPLYGQIETTEDVAFSQVRPYSYFFLKVCSHLSTGDWRNRC